MMMEFLLAQHLNNIYVKECPLIENLLYSLENGKEKRYIALCDIFDKTV